MTVRVPKYMAEDVRSVVLGAGLFDPERSIGRDREHVYLPVLLDSENESYLRSRLDSFENASLISCTDMTPRRSFRLTPFEQIRERLKGEMDRKDLESLPGSWELLGDCLIIKNCDLDRRKLMKAAEVYKEVLGSRYVLLDRGGVSGELRSPDHLTLIPPEDGVKVTDHIENGLIYRLDPSRIMFSSGNTAERVRSGKYPVEYPTDSREELVLDMFAGIGYFTMPVARSERVEKVLACEKNPLSHRFLRENVRLNDLGDKILPVLGDNRKCLPEGFADRIIMGYVGTTRDYLDSAISYLKPGGGIIHLHETVPGEVGVSGLADDLGKKFRDLGWGFELLDGYRIKWYAPRIEHVVVHLALKK